jgi:hypothetical protein
MTGCSWYGGIDRWSSGEPRPLLLGIYATNARRSGHVGPCSSPLRAANRARGSPAMSVRALFMQPTARRLVGVTLHVAHCTTDKRSEDRAGAGHAETEFLDYYCMLTNCLKLRGLKKKVNYISTHDSVELSSMHACKFFWHSRRQMP